MTWRQCEKTLETLANGQHAAVAGHFSSDQMCNTSTAARLKPLSAQDECL